MPILPREPDLFPDDLLSEATAAAPGAWWALYTLARREKELMRRLRALNIGHYGPLVRRKTQSPAGRVRESYVPLLAGYVFLHGGEEQRHQALQTNCVSRCLAVGNPTELVFDLRQIQRLIESQAPMTPEARLSAGMRVRVRSGSLMGLEGTVVERRGQKQLLVAIRFIQQGALVQIGDFQLEQIDG